MKRTLHPGFSELDEEIFLFILSHASKTAKSVSFFDVYDHATTHFKKVKNVPGYDSFAMRVHNSVNRLQRSGRIYTVDGTATLFLANPFSDLLNKAKERS